MNGEPAASGEVPLRSINAPPLRYGALPAHCRGRQAYPEAAGSPFGPNVSQSV